VKLPLTLRALQRPDRLATGTGSRHVFALLGWASIIGIAATSMLFTGCQQAQPTGRAAAIDSYIHGMMAYQAGDSDSAIASLRTAVDQHDNLVMAHAVLGDLYQGKAQFSNAAEQYLAVTRLDPYTGHNFYNLGLMYQMLDRLQDAVASYLRALQLNPRDFLSNLNLAAAYVALNQPHDAMPYAVRATELDETSSAAFFNLGAVHDALHEYAEAQKAFRRATELGDMPEAQLRLARDLIRDQKFSDARNVLLELTRNHDSAQARKLIGDTLLLQSKYDQAVAEFAKALKLDATYYPAMNDAGWALINQYTAGLGLDESKRQTAVEIWRRSLKVNGDQPKIKELIARYGEKYAE
jgi:tetratricopeptide (TPR) repeat protein